MLFGHFSLSVSLRLVEMGSNEIKFMFLFLRALLKHIDVYQNQTLKNIQTYPGYYTISGKLGSLSVCFTKCIY